jgi:hypothetical protein
MKTRDELRAIVDHFWELRRTNTEDVANYYLQSWLVAAGYASGARAKARVLRALERGRRRRSECDNCVTLPWLRVDAFARNMNITLGARRAVALARVPSPVLQPGNRVAEK